MSTRIRLRKIGRKKLPAPIASWSPTRNRPRDGVWWRILRTYDPKQEGAEKVVIETWTRRRG